MRQRRYLYILQLYYMNELLPKDPAILLSYVNMKLRDEYDSLEQMCNDLDIDGPKLIETLEKAGFQYDPQLNRFW